MILSGTALNFGVKVLLRRTLKQEQKISISPSSSLSSMFLL